MGYRLIFWLSFLLFVVPPAVHAQASTGPSSSQKHVRKHALVDSALDAGTVKDGVYQNAGLGFACKIPAGWVLRMEEMNARDDAHESDARGDARPADSERAPTADSRTALDRTAEAAVPTRVAEGGCPHAECGKVLLGAFSRPPEASGEDVNASIVIAAESAATYPGLKDAAQYFGPLTEVVHGQGFKVVEEPYEFPVGTKRLPRSDFQKDVGKHVMRQSTLVMLARGYVVSFTFIAGAEDEVEELVDGLSFGVVAKGQK